MAKMAMPLQSEAYARKHLEKALNDGYGHRDRAMRAIDAAIHECDQAVAAMH
jgi:hypothetical protein